MSLSVPYAGVHEDGYSGTQQVPAHARKQNTRNITHQARIGGARKISAQGVAFVRAYSRSIHIHARPYMHPAQMAALQDKDKILSEVLQGVYA